MSHTMPTVWWNIVWTFCHSTQCSFQPPTVASRWRLWEWFRYHWLTPLHHKRLLTFTMFPAWTTPHSTQFSPHLTVYHIHHPDQCTDTYLLALQITAFQTVLKYAQTTLMMKKKISRWYPWMMNTGLLKKHLIELYVSMNMDYHMDYANTHVLMRTITLFHTWTVWI